MEKEDFSQRCCRAATNRKCPSKSLRVDRRGATCSSIFLPSSLCVRTSGTHKGSSFQNTRQRTSSCILCTRLAIQRPLCATCGFTHDFFTCASLDGYAQGSCGGRIRHLWPADGQLRVSSIQPHRQISCPPSVLLQKELNSQLAFGEKIAFRL